jgi:hypothetical protein
MKVIPKMRNWLIQAFQYLQISIPKNDQIACVNGRYNRLQREFQENGKVRGKSSKFST